MYVKEMVCVTERLNACTHNDNRMVVCCWVADINNVISPTRHQQIPMETRW